MKAWCVPLLLAALACCVACAAYPMPAEFQPYFAPLESGQAVDLIGRIEIDDGDVRFQPDHSPPEAEKNCLGLVLDPRDVGIAEAGRGLVRIVGTTHPKPEGASRQTPADIDGRRWTGTTCIAPNLIFVERLRYVFDVNRGR